MMERDILETLNWEIYIVTPFQLVQYFTSQGILFTTDELEIRTNTF